VNGVLRKYKKIFIYLKGRLDCFDGIATVLKNLGKTFKVEKYNGITLQ
jgi:hypothetical protein